MNKSKGNFFKVVPLIFLFHYNQYSKNMVNFAIQNKKKYYARTKQCYISATDSKAKY